ncbi:MAG TPA: type II secretion system F family protein [Actinomycetota bacterium]
MSVGIAVALAFLGPALASFALTVRDRAVVRASLSGSRGRRGGPFAMSPGRLRMLAMGAALVVSSAAGFAIAGSIGAAAAGSACVIVPLARRRRREGAETAALEDGLAEAVAAIAAAIRAGRSMAGALDEAASTVPPPLGPRLAALVDRVSLGVPVERAVTELAEAVPGPDARLVAAVLGLHQRSGGDAPAVLDRVARTLRDRRASAREIRSLTAQARLSGAILGFLPIGFFLFLSVTARADVERALGSTTGLTAIVAGLAMQAVAFAWIRRLLRVDR